MWFLNVVFAVTAAVAVWVGLGAINAAIGYGDNVIYLRELNKAQKNGEEYEFVRYLRTEPVIGVYAFVSFMAILILTSRYPDMLALWAAIAVLLVIGVRPFRNLANSFVDTSMREHGGRKEWLARGHIKSAQYGVPSVIYQNRHKIRKRLLEGIKENSEEE